MSSAAQSPTPDPWSPDSWTEKTARQLPVYQDPAALEAALAKLRSLPPLVTSWEIERLKSYIADAQRGERFILQGGDCAETLDECRSDIIANKLKILLQMSLVLVHASKRPVVRIGRFAGQYAKPRSSAMERREDTDGSVTELPSYFGDLSNRHPFTAEARAFNPQLLVDGYTHASMTLNFIRSLTEGGFADLMHPENWTLSKYQAAKPDQKALGEYQRMVDEVIQSLHFMKVFGEKLPDLDRVEFFTSHEGLNLYYEAAQTRRVPRRDGYYNLTTHLPWIGERTRQLDGAHIEFFRGIANPVGVKVGPTAEPDDVIALLDVLNPSNEVGKIVLVPRMGAEKVADRLPRLLRRVREEGRAVAWVTDPMHGNTKSTDGGRKTRYVEDIMQEIELTFELHAVEGTHLGGIHFELTGDDVTECVGGATGLSEVHLDENYASLCDPRLNYSQSLELAMRVARWMRH
ncbi:MAG: 3-deoxy-7-phosphoheptulonate synthase class II [Myxococcota bacterium]